MFRVLLPFFLSLIILSASPPVNGQINSTTNIGTELLQVEKISITGNKVTKEKIITRELSFKVGDKIGSNDLLNLKEENEKRLTNLGLFVSNEIEINRVGDKMEVLINLVERWYIFPIPQLSLGDRNFNVWWEQYNHDIDRLIYGIDFYWENFQGRNEQIFVKARTGFKQSFALAYQMPAVNGDFRHGLKVETSLDKERLLSFRTINNAEEFLEGDDFQLSDFKIGGLYTNRINYHQQHQVGMHWRNITIKDSLLAANPKFLSDPNGTDRFLTLSYAYTLNHRNIRAYPTKGYYLQLGATKEGLGVFGSTNRFLTDATLQGYLDIGKGIYLSQHLSGRMAWPKDRAFYFDQALGDNQDFARGYEFYVLDGPDYFLSRTNIRKQLFKLNIDVPLIDWEQIDNIPLEFYLKIFNDFGRVGSNPSVLKSGLNDSWLHGYGIGLDLVTYYDWVFRLEYSINREQEKGLFLHFEMDLSTED